MKPRNRTFNSLKTKKFLYKNLPILCLKILPIDAKLTNFPYIMTNF